MVRSVFCGNTKYSNQSLDHLFEDLGNWIISIKSTKKDLLRKRKQIEDSDFTKDICCDFEALINESIVSLETFETEITEILFDIKNEVVERHHTKRLKKIGEIASDLNKKFGIVWHQKYKNKDYGKPWFREVEFLYISGRDEMTNLMDLISLSERLEDFIGRKKRKSQKLKFLKGIAEWLIKLMPILKPLLAKIL